MNNLIDVLVPDSPGNTVNDPLLVNSEPNLLSLSTYIDLSELIAQAKSTFSSSSSNLNVLSLNCESFRSKFSSLQIMLDELNENDIILHVLCFQESWFDNDVDLNPWKLPKYHDPYSLPKRLSERGGLVIYVHSSLKFNKLPNVLSPVFESQCVEIYYPGFESKKVYICNVYRPENVPNFTR